MTTLSRTKRFSRRLILFTVGFIVIIGFSLTIINYFSQISLYEQKELSKLSAITRTLALSIDGDELEQLMQDYPEKDAIFKNTDDDRYFYLHRLIESAMNANELETNIYTMILDSANNNFCFGVTSAQLPYWKHSYTKFPDKLREQYKEGGTIEPYEDENGIWLSAFTPIRNSSGKVISVIQADEKFTNFVMKARSTIWKYSLFSFLVAGVLGAIMIYIVRSIAQKQEKLEEDKREVESMRKELIANVSHDLRTPLAYIQGYLETLLMKKGDLDDARMTRYLETSLEGTERLKKLVDELFELSRIESGNRKLDKEPILLAELVADVLRPFQLQAGEKGIKLEMDVPIELPAVSADLALLDRVFQNLVSNSIKFCRKNDSIRVTARETESGGVQVVVEDTGPGISEENLPYIFDRFRRGDQTHRQGTGLGLAIVKSILELHQCEYGIESEAKKGTKFYFTLAIYPI